jgi:hypothetical protein
MEQKAPSRECASNDCLVSSRRPRKGNNSLENPLFYSVRSLLVLIHSLILYFASDACETMAATPRTARVGMAVQNRDQMPVTAFYYKILLRFFSRTFSLLFSPLFFFPPFISALIACVLGVRTVHVYARGSGVFRCPLFRTVG